MIHPQKRAPTCSAVPKLRARAPWLGPVERKAVIHLQADPFTHRLFETRMFYCDPVRAGQQKGNFKIAFLIRDGGTAGIGIHVNRVHFRTRNCGP